MTASTATSTAVLVDTNVMVAAADAADPNHASASALLTTSHADLVVVTTVVAEVCYLLDKYLGPAVEAEFLRNIARGELTHVDLVREDFGRMAELPEQYSDLPLGGTDASLIAVAEWSNIDTIATFDRRHFTVVRPRHLAAFTLLPA